MENRMTYEAPLAEIYPIALEQCIMNKASGEGMEPRDEDW